MARDTARESDPRVRQTPGGGPGYVVRPVPKARQPVLDRLVGASRRFQVHALVELDVSEPAARIAAADSRVSWTGFLMASMARAVAVHPEVNARKAGNRILYFDRVDLGATVERHWEGRTVLDVVVIPEADRKSCAEISEVLRRTKYGPGQHYPQPRATAMLVRLPGPLRRTAIRMAATSPGVAATFGPAVRAGQIVARPMLPLTLTFDHAVVDGAPAARFAETLRELVETAAAFEPPPAHGA